MKRVLILNYHFPPLNVIASRRTEAYARHLHKSGWHPTILTHQWYKSGEKWLVRDTEEILKESSEKCTILRIGMKDVEQKKLDRIFQNRILRQTKILSFWKKGFFDLEKQGLDSYQAFKNFCFSHVKELKYDLILAIYSPHHHLRLAYELNKKFEIPYILDFRDLYHVKANVGIENSKEKIKARFTRRYWKKWSSKATAFFTVSQPYRDFLQEELKLPGIVLRNGFEPKDLGKPIKPSEPFTILHAGTIYPHQDLEPLFRVVSKWKLERSRNIKIQFIGINDNSIVKEIEALAIKYSIPDLEIQPRINREEILIKMRSAHVLFYPCWENNPGVYSGKIFEYIGAERPILAYPSDRNVVSELLNHYQGSEVHTEKDAMEFLEQVWNEELDDSSFNSQVREECKREWQIGKAFESLQKYLP